MISVEGDFVRTCCTGEGTFGIKRGNSGVLAGFGLFLAGIALISVNQLAVSVLPPLISAHTITATASEFFRPDVVACMNACQMTLFPVFRKNFIATDALFPYLTASAPLLLAYNRFKIAFHIQICIFVAVSYDFLIEKIVSERFQIRGIPLIG